MSAQDASSGDSPGKNRARGKGSRFHKKERRKAPPLDETGLRDLALSYAARFATTAAKLEGYLARKIRERGVAQDDEQEYEGRTRELDVTGLITRLVELGYVDDDAFARSRSRDLTARGYGKRRVEQALWAAGVEEETRATHAPGEGASRRAAMLLAQKRKVGPFAMDAHAIDAHEESPESNQSPEDRALAHKAREKQVAAMLRAGHVYEHVQFILAAANRQEVEDWVIEAEDDERANDW